MHNYKTKQQFCTKFSKLIMPLNPQLPKQSCIISNILQGANIRGNFEIFSINYV